MMLDKLAGFIVKWRKVIIAVFLVMAVACIPLAMQVKINYNILDYLPQSSQSTVAINVMTSEYKDSIPDTTVMIEGIDLVQGQEYKQKLLEIDGVESVTWLGDVVDIYQPLEFADQSLVEQYYRDGTALFSLATTAGAEKSVINSVLELVKPTDAVGGETAMMAAMQDATVKEVSGAFIILIPAIIIILALSTRTWLEPLFLLISIGVAIVLNMGTNIVFDNVSFITSSVSPILQMAVSLDYAIFLLHAFADYRKVESDSSVAMKRAIVTSFSTVSASASTTLFGFFALIFMQFLIGADLGINLVKGIVFSFLTAMVFLPAAALAAVNLMDKTKHRPLLPSFENIHRVLSKVSIPVAVVVILVVVPSFLGQSHTNFLYGIESAGAGTRAAADDAKIKEAFGENNTLAVMVPRGDIVREAELCEAIKTIDGVSSVVSYTQAVGTEIPPEILDHNITEQFYSANYARAFVYLDLPSEGDVTFAKIAQILDKVHEYYSEDSYVLGRSANLYDMKEVVQSDNLRVNIIAVIAIFLVLLVTFRSAILPFVLTLTIETAIWINLAVPYFADTSVNYIGYLVLNTVQLGATVDYAILLTNGYMQNRKSMPKRPAISKALGTSFKSILVSATTLSLAGFVLFATSSNPVVCDIGMMLGRGTILSFALVICFLPFLLMLLDPLIGKFTLKANFFKSKRINMFKDSIDTKEV